MKPNKHAIQYTSIPAWTYTGKTPSRLTFFESIALAGLEGQWIRLSIGDQRATLGRNVFGKQEIKVDDCGNVKVRRSAAFGKDFELQEYPPYEIARALTEGKEIAPGKYGPKYLRDCPMQTLTGVRA